ncbi:unnamed protein product [Medioppia subpectinata]|uniref:CWF21 domain-containing protein n=1 Tax=Medioppia subpectinata TaxID=1979941 RepID=A0A7R9QEM5_9ACAR|nr:unnamed protein product [Medioppia subpectinata]CAG2119387.1 unnamed protein product [Medioppia subpectinata]
MYNGIGLQTARGSGTNGYIQRNLSFVKQIKDKIQYKSEDDFKRLERELNKVPNKEILEHQNKRQIELKCLQMEEQMELQGFTEEVIDRKVKEYRKELTLQMERQKETTDPKKDWFDDSPQK